MKTEPLYIIDSYPTEENIRKIKSFLPCQNGTLANIFFIDYGVFWLIDPFWPQVFTPKFIYYAHAHDAEKYSIPFKDEVVFSGMPTLEQLISSSKNIFRFNED